MVLAPFHPYLFVSTIFYDKSYLFIFMGFFIFFIYFFNGKSLILKDTDCQIKKGLNDFFFFFLFYRDFMLMLPNSVKLTQRSVIIWNRSQTNKTRRRGSCKITKKITEKALVLGDGEPLMF